MHTLIAVPHRLRQLYLHGSHRPTAAACLPALSAMMLTRPRLVSRPVRRVCASLSTAASRVNGMYEADAWSPPELCSTTPNGFDAAAVSERHWDSAGSWSSEDIRTAQHSHVVGTWGPTNAISEVPIIEHADGVYLYTKEGKQMIDWTSQALCVNLGHTVPPSVSGAIAQQLECVPHIYGGLGMTEIRARLAALMADILPGDIEGFLFPSSGADANEAAVRLARKFTGKHKIVTLYRSYHGGSATTLSMTGDYRRWFAEAGMSGFVKAMNPTPLLFQYGATPEEAAAGALAALEEQILHEGPQTIAALMIESVVGSGGVLMAPPGYVQGVRALCDKYEILYIADEVMVGFGRTGKMWGFEHYDGVLPDIVTSAKGLSGAYLPLSVVGMRREIKEFFDTTPVGWGQTYHAHPVSMACAYECIKHMIDEDLVGNAARLEATMVEQTERVIERHPSVRSGRAVGLFGCLDLVGHDGKYLQPVPGPPHPAVPAFKRALFEEGVYCFLRAPLFHTAPPLPITEGELVDGWARVDRALDVLDRGI